MACAKTYLKRTIPTTPRRTSQALIARAKMYLKQAAATLAAPGQAFRALMVRMQVCLTLTSPGRMRGARGAPSGCSVRVVGEGGAGQLGRGGY